ncbi:MAG: universal stress protein [Nitrospirae bacterium]|nr:universal stress protein [Nitrospirota bacterium]
MKILLATDGSEHSLSAAQFLTRFRLGPQDEIAVLYAVNWMPVVSELETYYPDFEDIRREVVPRILGATEDILKGVKAKVSSMFVEDFPDKAIVKEASARAADLIVMGAGGVRGLGSYLVGSVTRGVAIQAAGPVLIINPPQQEKAGKLKILFATDGSGHSDAVGKTLSKIPFPEDTEVVVLNVIFPVLSEIPERFALELDDKIKKLAAGARAEELTESGRITKKVRGYLEDRFSKIEEITRAGDPSGEILNVAAELNADIIAVGSSGMRGIRGMMGSVSRRILNHCRCSVLICKA